MKKWFVSLRYPVPTAMEDYLEDLAREGHLLKQMRQGGLFYYDFDTKMGEKCCYMVDAIPTDQGMYLYELTEKGWEYLGKSGNLIIAKKKYTDRRPEKPVNEVLRVRHCRNVGFAYLALGTVFLLLCIMATYSLWRLRTVIDPKKTLHMIIAIVQLVVQLPLSIFSFRNAKLCLGFHPVIRRQRKVVEEKDERLEFLGETDKSEEESKEEPKEYVSIFGEEEDETELDFLKENK